MLHFSGQPVDLVAVQKQFAAAVRDRRRVLAGVGQGRKVGAHQPGFLLLYGDIGLNQARAVGPQGLDFPAQQSQPRVEFFENLETAVGPPVYGNTSGLRFACHGG